jgi:hypothetical protein
MSSPHQVFPMQQMMQTGLNENYPPAVVSSASSFSLFPSLATPPCSMATTDNSHYVSPPTRSSFARSLSSSTGSSDHSTKRSRDDLSEASSLDGDTFDLSNSGHGNTYPSSCMVPSMYPAASSSSYHQSQQCTTKKTRPNTYIAPRKVSHTFLSSMGSLAACTGTIIQGQPCFTYNNNKNDTAATASSHRVPHRRQLSASKLDPFLSRHSHHGTYHSDNNITMSADNDSDMDVEERPRSMSF